MKTLKKPVCAAIAVLFLLGAGLALARPDWIGAGAAAGLLTAAAAIGLCGALLRHMRREDRAAAREARQCLVRTEADEAVLEADLLLARLSASSVQRGADPASQLMMIQAELTHMQYGATDPAVAARLEHVRGRVERVAHALRRTVRAAEAG